MSNHTIRLAVHSANIAIRLTADLWGNLRSKMTKANHVMSKFLVSSYPTLTRHVFCAKKLTTRCSLPAKRRDFPL